MEKILNRKCLDQFRQYTDNIISIYKTNKKQLQIKGKFKLNSQTNVLNIYTILLLNICFIYMHIYMYDFMIDIYDIYVWFFSHSM